MSDEIRDVRGVLYRFDGAPRRVVSLVPSITETLFELDVGRSVVGITEWCIFPERLRTQSGNLGGVPRRVGGTKNPDVEAIRLLSPDLVYMNLEENLAKHADAIEEFVPLFATEPKTPNDVVGLIRDLGVIHDCQAAAAGWIDRIESELEKPPLPGFTFVCPIWKSPWMWCGGDTYVSALVESVGGRNLLGEYRRYPSLDVEEIERLSPDVVFLPDEPFEFTERDAKDLRDCTRAQIVGPFPGHLFTWHGTRTLLGMRSLRTWLTWGLAG